MLSVQPRWCEKIAIQEKSLEIRKTRPNIQTPFKCYIYQTKRNWVYKLLAKLRPLKGAQAIMDGQSRVIGEFVCNSIKAITASEFLVKEDADKAIQGSCLTRQEIIDYAGWKAGMCVYDCRTVYGWHISNLVIYDKPKPLSNFNQCHKCPYGDCENCIRHEYSCNGDYRLTRPPQSWCYVEELEGGEGNG